jgi:hypothetical protein
MESIAAELQVHSRITGINSNPKSSLQKGLPKKKLTAGSRVKKIKPLTSGPEEKKTRRHVQMKVV